MSGLKALLAQRAAQKASENVTGSEPAGPTAESAGQNAAASPVQQEAAPSGDAKDEAPASKPKLGFLAKNLIPKAVTPAKVESTDGDMDLASLGEIEDEGSRLSSGFADELPAIEAVKPDRVVPDDADKGMLQFVSTMDSVYAVLDEPEMLGAVIRNIMVELKSYPHYSKMIAPEDVRTWVRSMRNTMGLAKIKKTEAKAKRTTGGAKAKGSKHLDSDMEKAFADLGIDFDNL
jgi:hypothetical protein